MGIVFHMTLNHNNISRFSDGNTNNLMLQVFLVYGNENKANKAVRAADIAQKAIHVVRVCGYMVLKFVTWIIFHALKLICN